MHIDFLRHLRDTVRRKRPENWGTKSWFLHHDNAPAHRSVLVKDFLAKNSVKTPELGPAEFYLFRRLKSALKQRRFGDATGFIKNATKELERLHKMASRNVSNTFTVTGRRVWR